MKSGQPKVFISYRRDETPVRAGRAEHAMVARFGERHVFMDLSMEPGINFVDRITEVVASCHVLLVVMGPRRATPLEEGSQASIEDPDDFVRLEVETALGNQDVAVIPLLVARAEMPEPGELPTSLWPLTQINPLELSEQRWHHDVGLLRTRLEGLLAGTSAVHEIPAEMSKPQQGNGSASANGSARPPAWYLAAGGALVALAFAAIAALGRARGKAAQPRAAFAPLADGLVTPAA